MAQRWQWLSSNPDKAWAELYFLAQSPLWMAAVAAAMLTGWMQSWSELGYLSFGCAAMAPAVLGPAVLHKRYAASGSRIVDSYWVRLNLWVAVLVVFGTYFGTHYFFDLMGMKYAFAVEWNFGSEVVGRTPGQVPVFMYPLTHAYFVSYYVGMGVAWRGLRTRFGLGAFGSGLISGLSLLGLSYAVAFGETFFMANEALEDVFAYADRARMLWLGSWGYAVYFLIGLPMVARLGEPTAQGNVVAWPLRQVIVEALATCMLVLCGLEVWAKLVGAL